MGVGFISDIPDPPKTAEADKWNFNFQLAVADIFNHIGK